MTTSSIRNKARKFVMVNKLSPIGLYALNLLAFVSFLVLGFATDVSWFVAIPLVLYYFLYAPVIFSSADFYLRSYNLRYQELFKFFEGFARENIFRTLVLHVILTAFSAGYIVAIVTGIIVGVVSAPWIGVLIAIGLAVVFFAPTTYIMSRSAFAYYFLIMDKNLSPWEAVKKSFAATQAKGRTMGIIKLFLSYFGWFALGIVTAGLGFVYAIPHYQTAKSIFFRNVVLEIDDDVPLEELIEIFKSPYNYTGLRDEVTLDTLTKPLESTITAARRKKKNSSKNRHLLDDSFETQAIEVRALINSHEHSKLQDAPIKEVEGILEPLEAIEPLAAASAPDLVDMPIKEYADISTPPQDSVDVSSAQPPIFEDITDAMQEQDLGLLKHLEIKEEESFTEYRERVDSVRTEGFKTEMHTLSEERFAIDAIEEDPPLTAPRTMGFGRRISVGVRTKDPVASPQAAPQVVPSRVSQVGQGNIAVEEAPSRVQRASSVGTRPVMREQPIASQSTAVAPTPSFVTDTAKPRYSREEILERLKRNKEK